MSGDARDDLARVGAVEFLIAIVEERHFVDTKNLRRGMQLGLANARQRRAARMPRVARPLASVAAAVAARRGEEKRLDALRRVLGERAAAAEGFIIGVSE